MEVALPPLRSFLSRRPLVALGTAGMLLAAACSGEDAAGEGDGRPDTTAEATAGPPDESTTAAGPEVAGVTVPQIPESAVEDGPSGLQAVLGETVSGLPEPTIDLEEIRPGGPPPDGIPPIDEPRFVAAGDVGYLADNEPVLALEVDGEARAYPVQILIWHEIVNDTVGGVPVAVTYCPLCNSAIAYDRRVGERVVSFGTSGLLWNSALVMYDRQTETLWSHFTGGGVHGVLAGTELDVLPMATVPWSLWREAHPDGMVLSRDTGFTRNYGRNPYPGYDNAGSFPFLFEGTVDGRYTAMTRVVGVEAEGSGLAVPLADLQDQRVVATELDGRPLVVWWSAGTASALDAGEIAEGEDVGATGVFVPEIDGRSLTFEADGVRFVDTETGSTWNLLGQAVAGPLEGDQLTAVPHTDTFWFAWSTFVPETSVVGTT